MAHDVRQEVHGDVHVLVEDLEVEAGVLLRVKASICPPTESTMRAMSWALRVSVP